MKTLVQILIGILFLISCNQISKNTENSFIEINKKLIDSIMELNLQNQSLFDSLNSIEIKQLDEENIATVYYSITNLNQLIDSIQNELITNSNFTSDIVSTTELLVEKKTCEKNSEAKSTH